MKSSVDALTFYDALKRITCYDSVERIRRTAEKRYGLSPEEAIEMAYENVIQEAHNAIRGKRRPKTQEKGV